MSRVHFMQKPNDPRINLETAKEFGELSFLFPANFAVSLAPGPSFKAAQQELKDFDPRQDYLGFCGGDQMALGVAVMALAQRGIHSVKFLRWDRLDGGRYEESWIGSQHPCE